MGYSRRDQGVSYLERAPLRRLYHPASAATPPHDPSDDYVEEGLVAEDDDPAAATAASPTRQELCTVLLSICYSPTYGVPVLWFEAHKSSGTPLSLDEVLRSTLFHATALSVASTRTVEGTTPFLSQADHPATGRPSWFLHPCETEGMMREVLQAGQGGTSGSREDGESWEQRWMQSWLMVVGGVVDLHE